MKICVISDTHTQRPRLPPADLLVHCGDLTGSGLISALLKERDWLASLLPNYPQGVLYCPGNHDKALDPVFNTKNIDLLEQFEDAGIMVPIDEALIVDGINFFVSPQTPIFLNWAFMKDESSLSRVWSTIPEITDVLISHGPAQELRDFCGTGHAGSSSLRWHLEYRPHRIKLHAFGHIHEGAGFHYQDNPASHDGRYLCLNASVLDGQYKGFNPIHIVDTDTWRVEVFTTLV